MRSPVNATRSRPATDLRRAGRWPAAALLLGLVLTLLAIRSVHQQSEEAARAEFLRLTERVAVDTARRFTLPVNGLKGLRGVFATGSRVGPSEFRAYVASRDLPSEFPGIRGFGFIERVQRSQIERFTSAARRAGAPGFTVRTGSAAGDLYVIKYIEPLANNTAAWGFDVGSEAKRRAAVEQAIVTGRPTLTAQVQLLLDQRRGPGFLLMLPVYRAGATLDGDVSRTQALLGVLYAPIVAAELLDGVAEVAGHGLDVEIFEGDDVQPAHLVYDDDGSMADPRQPAQDAPQSANAVRPAPRFSATRQLLLGDRTFTLRTATRPAFDDIHSQGTSTIVALAGVALSLLVAWAVWLLANGRAQVEARARALTAELGGLALIANRTTNAVVITDARGRIRWINEGFTRTSGYTPQEAIGRTMADLVGTGMSDPAVIERLEAGMLDGTPVIAEVVNRARDGHLYWMQLDVQPTLEADGAVSGFMEIGTDITAFKLAEQQLQRSRDEATALAAELETMALVARHTTNAVVVADADRRVRWVNEGFSRITGYTAHEIVGRSPGSLLQCERTDASVVAAMRAALDAGRSFQGELINRNKAGRDYWIDIHITPLHGEDGSLSGFVAIESDISDRKAAEATLAQERNWLAHVVAGADAGEGDFNLRTREIRWSRRAAAILGYSVEEIEPLAPRWGSPLQHPDDLKGAVRAMSAYLRGKTQHLVAEYRMRHRDGHWVWIQTRATASAWAADGSVEWLSGMNLDVTERRRTTDQLRESLALVDALFESLPIPVVLKDTQFRYQRMNKAYADLFATDAASLVGKTAYDVIDSKAAQRHFDEDEQILKTGGTVSYEVQQEVAHGRRFDALVSKTALIGTGGQVLGLIGTFVDISQRIAAERAMADARAAAEAANSAKSAFLATMSHEIRTPMNGVMGMAELLAHSPLNDEQAQTVRTIISSGQSLLGLIDDILDFSKIEAGRMELDIAEFALTPLVEGVCATLLPLAIARDVHLSAWVDASAAEQVVGDALRVRQLLNNLVGNAIKFSARSDGLPGRVAVKVQANGDGLRFEVADNGIGMDEATIARLFTPFTQAEVSTTRRFGGTGLGLAICRRLVEMMGGSIGVQSAPAAGSTFSFTLPLRPGAAQSAADAPLLAGLHCVLVPGQALPLAQLRQWLQRAGAEVQEAHSLDAALQRAAAGGADASATIVVHAGPPADAAQPGFASPGTAAAVAPAGLQGPGLRQLVVGYGRRETARVITPTVAGIDLLRREPFVKAIALVAGRLASSPRAGLQPDTPTSACRPLTPKQARGTGQLILVAEDDATNRAVLQRQLAILGHTADFANDGDQALACWRNGRYALLLTDLCMPEMDGHALSGIIRLEEVASGRPRMPIVALSANALKGEIVRAREAGIDDYLTKPVPLAQLRSTLNAWMPARLSAPASAPAPAPDPEPQPVAASAVLDLQVLRALIGDDEVGLRELLADFTLSARQHGADLRAALLAGDAGAVIAAAHKLKSASRSVGARALGEACAALEAAGLAGEAALSYGHLEGFEDALAAVFKSAQSWPEVTTA
jgi:PAS domain S-box-containing protein